jgi:hypothetical protein
MGNLSVAAAVLLFSVCVGLDPVAAQVETRVGHLWFSAQGSAGWQSASAEGVGIGSPPACGYSDLPGIVYPPCGNEQPSPDILPKSGSTYSLLFSAGGMLGRSVQLGGALNTSWTEGVASHPTADFLATVSYFPSSHSAAHAKQGLVVTGDLGFSYYRMTVCCGWDFGMGAGYAFDADQHMLVTPNFRMLARVMPGESRSGLETVEGLSEQLIEFGLGITYH